MAYLGRVSSLKLKLNQTETTFKSKLHENANVI